MTASRCADCIHFAEWPERMKRYSRYTQIIPSFPLYACMVSPCKVFAVAPDYSPDDESCDAYGCVSFERGDRNDYIKEVNHAD